LLRFWAGEISSLRGVLKYMGLGGITTPLRDARPVKSR
jgi:hypothetical protein